MNKNTNYLDFLNEIKGKTINEVKNYIKDNNVIKNDLEVINVYDALQDLYTKLQIASTSDNVQRIFVKKVFVYYSILEHFTNLDITSDQKVIENLNIYLEKALIEMSDKICLFNELSKEIIVEERFKIIEELTEVFKSGLPSVEEINSLQDSLENMFKDESPEKLEKIENILAFNDPVMKDIKNILVNPTLQEKVSDKNGGDNNS